MSDFDKEAERERLREQYEREQKRREATERMSELLLKGATMTNTHCEECGDPIFRYDGQEFCPSCQQPVTEDGQPAAEEQAGDGSAAGEPTAEEPTAEEPTAEEQAAGVDTDDDAASDTASGSVPATANGQRDTDRDTDENRSTDAETAAAGSEAGTARPEIDAEATPDAEVRATTAETSAERTTAATGGSPAASSRDVANRTDDSADLAAARETLTRTLLRQARLAEDCRDPGQARDHLAAAREAAEALSALSVD